MGSLCSFWIRPPTFQSERTLHGTLWRSQSHWTAKCKHARTTPSLRSSSCCGTPAHQPPLATTRTGALDELGALLEVDDERVVLNGIKLITTLAEHPMGRSQLQALVPKLTALKDYPGGRLDHMAVPRNAQTAIDTIVWKP